MLRIAIQAKGRLNEQSMELLREAGVDIDDSKRKFLTPAGNFPAEVLSYPPQYSPLLQMVGNTDNIIHSCYINCILAEHPERLVL